MDLEEMSIYAGNWVDSAEDMDYWRALVNAALKLRVPQAMELVSCLMTNVALAHVTSHCREVSR